jgi:hypothetical protein
MTISQTKKLVLEHLKRVALKCPRGRLARRIWMMRYAHRVVNPNYYGTITIVP